MPGDHPRLSTEGYLWKRHWTPGTADAANLARGVLDQLVVLGAEIDRWPSATAAGSVIWPDLDQAALQGAPIGLAVRAPAYSGPFATDQPELTQLDRVVRELVTSAEAGRLEIGEIQIDFDCPQRKLEGYRRWLIYLRNSIPPAIDLTITALPSWLEEAAWPALAKASDGFVLQVHSVVAGSPGEPPAALCDPDHALRWSRLADQAGVPFRIALPTYTSRVGYRPDGNLLGVISDGPEPAWPPGTRMTTFRANPTAMSDLRHALAAASLKNLTGLIWFRVPVGDERRNWSWNTFKKVATGPPARSQPVPVLTGDQTVDIAIDFRSTLPGPLPDRVQVSFPPGSRVLASDGVRGYSCTILPGFAVFQPSPSMLSSQVEGEGLVPIGWLRFDRVNPQVLDVEIGE